jgi:hypothetical protein
MQWDRVALEEDLAALKLAVRVLTAIRRADWSQDNL